MLRNGLVERVGNVVASQYSTQLAAFVERHVSWKAQPAVRSGFVNQSCQTAWHEIDDILVVKAEHTHTRCYRLASLMETNCSSEFGDTGLSLPLLLSEGLSIDLSCTEGPSQFDGHRVDDHSTVSKLLQLDEVLAFEYVKDVIDQELAFPNFCLEI